MYFSNSENKIINNDQYLSELGRLVKIVDETIKERYLKEVI